MARRRKNVGCLWMMLSICFAIPKFFIDLALDYRPYNSTGAKISRAKKKKWF